MKIAIIGAGNIGSTLGKKWGAAGHEVLFGVRNVADSKFDGLRPLGSVVPVAESLKGAGVVLLSLPGGAVAEFAAQHGADLAGKVVIDATNNVRSPEMHSIPVLREKAPSAHLGRAFNTLGWENFANPQINGVPIDLFYCAAPAAQETVAALITAVGLHPIYVGDVEVANTLDGMTRMWFALVFGQNKGRRVAFKLMTEL